MNSDSMETKVICRDDVEDDEIGKTNSDQHSEVIAYVLTDDPTTCDDNDIKPNESTLIEIEKMTTDVGTCTENVVTVSESLGTLTTVALADGTTALLRDGEAIQLEDGTTAYIQSMTDKVEEEGDTHNNPKFIDGQAIQLEDGTTAFIHTSPREGLQAVQLEDGTTAYIASVPPGLFDGDTESLALEPFEGTQSEDGCEFDKITLPRPLSVLSKSLPHVSSTRAIALGDKAFRCLFSGCGRLYTTQHHLRVHERSHTGDRPFRCESPGCNKAFATGYGLKSHTRVHTGEKPYNCTEMNCDKAFKTSGDLQKHVRTHTGERPFKCPFHGCDRSFTTSNIRKVHVRTHTGERPYICNEEGCGRAFASATNYKNHIRIHTGEKPYICPVQGCSKRFTEYSSLYKHHVVHSHTKPYVCNLCGKNYRQTSTLAIHKRTIHGVTDGTEDADLVEIEGEDEDDLEDMSTTTNNETPKKRQRIQVMLTSTDIVATATDQGTIVTLEAAESVQRVHEQQIQIEGDTRRTPHIVVVTDAAQFAALQQLTQQHQLTVTSPSAAIDGTVTVSSTESIIASSDGTVVTYSE